MEYRTQSGELIEVGKEYYLSENNYSWKVVFIANNQPYDMRFLIVQMEVMSFNYKSKWVASSELKLNPKTVDFAAALKAMKEGKKVRRYSWINQTPLELIGDKFKLGELIAPFVLADYLLATDWIILEE